MQHLYLKSKEHLTNVSYLLTSIIIQVLPFNCLAFRNAHTDFIFHETQLTQSMTLSKLLKAWIVSNFLYRNEQMAHNKGTDVVSAKKNCFKS